MSLLLPPDQNLLPEHGFLTSPYSPCCVSCVQVLQGASWPWQFHTRGKGGLPVFIKVEGCSTCTSPSTTPSSFEFNLKLFEWALPVPAPELFCHCKINLSHILLSDLAFYKINHYQKTQSPSCSTSVIANHSWTGSFYSIPHHQPKVVGDENWIHKDRLLVKQSHSKAKQNKEFVYYFLLVGRCSVTLR